MKKSFADMLAGYQEFLEKYVHQDNSIMHKLADRGQHPKVMIIACCDSRVDPALILQCDPGDLFVVRNVANIVPPFEKDNMHHGTSAALEFGICNLKVEHLIILGHSQCGGIDALLNAKNIAQNDFISNWVNLIPTEDLHDKDQDTCAKLALIYSLQNSLTFPWLKERVAAGTLQLHLWFFDIKEGQIFSYQEQQLKFVALSSKMI